MWKDAILSWTSCRNCAGTLPSAWGSWDGLTSLYLGANLLTGKYSIFCQVDSQYSHVLSGTLSVLQCLVGYIVRTAIWCQVNKNYCHMLSGDLKVLSCVFRWTEVLSCVVRWLRSLAWSSVCPDCYAVKATVGMYQDVPQGNWAFLISAEQDSLAGQGQSQQNGVTSPI